MKRFFYSTIVFMALFAGIIIGSYYVLLNARMRVLDSNTIILTIAGQEHIYIID